MDCNVPNLVDHCFQSGKLTGVKEGRARFSFLGKYREVKLSSIEARGGFWLDLSWLASIARRGNTRAVHTQSPFLVANCNVRFTGIR